LGFLLASQTCLLVSAIVLWQFWPPLLEQRPVFVLLLSASPTLSAHLPVSAVEVVFPSPAVFPFPPKSEVHLPSSLPSYLQASSSLSRLSISQT
jgi:hypothetical protein